MIKDILLNHFPSLSAHTDLKNKLADICTIQSFKKGDVILKNGSYIKVIPLLVKGLVKISKEDDLEGEVLLYYIKEGESCVMSMTALIRDQKVEVKGVVEEDSEILLIPANEALLIAKEFKEWNEFTYDLFSNKYNELLSVISVLTFSKKDVRLLNYLKEQVQLKNNVVVSKTHLEIATDLGSSREVISRLLKKMEQNGEIRLAQGKIEVLVL